jgi:hypothetical protein
MWRNVVTVGHLRKLSQDRLRELPDDLFSVAELGDEYACIWMRTNFVPAGNETELLAYKELATYIEPVSTAEFDPILFRFSYKWPDDFGHLWIRRFVDPAWFRAVESNTVPINS